MECYFRKMRTTVMVRRVWREPIGCEIIKYPDLCAVGIILRATVGIQ